MEVEVHQAILIIEGKRKTLNKAVAKQFPFRPADTRSVAAGMAREPIAKVRGEVLDRISGWLYLVKDEVAGLAWEPAVTYGKDYDNKMREGGYHVDDPATVPTIIL